MNDSRLSESSYSQDYVLTSYINPIETGNNQLTPLSLNNYQLNHQQHQFNADHVFSSSPKQGDQTYKVTPHPLNMDRETSKKKELLNFDSDNKENMHVNFHLFEPLEYEKLFEKKINFSLAGYSSSKKSRKQISELSNESKKFIQRSIHQNILSNSPISQKCLSSSKKHSSSCKRSSPDEKQIPIIQLDQSNTHCIQGIPVIESNETIPPNQILEMNFGSSSRQQTNTYSTGKINLGLIEQNEKMENERDFEEVPSFNEKQEIIEYFLTEEDDPNEHNDSEQGIQLLSELKSQLNSLINGSVQNSRTSSNNISKHARTIQDIKSFGTGSNQGSVVSKMCTNAYQQLASKLEDLKTNIFNLHSKISTSSNFNQKVATIQFNIPKAIKFPEGSPEKEISQKKQPEIYFQTVKMEKKPKKLIYPDSRIIFSRNDGEFVDFNDEFSKILNESFNENVQNSSRKNLQFLTQESPVIVSLKNSLEQNQMKASKIISSHEKSQYESERKDFGNDTEKFQTQEKMSLTKIEIEKEAFKMSYPNFYDFENQQEKYSNVDKSQNVNLGNSHLSSTSNEGFMLQELNMKFNSRFNELLQFNN